MGRTPLQSSAGGRLPGCLRWAEWTGCSRGRLGAGLWCDSWPPTERSAAAVVLPRGLPLEGCGLEYRLPLERLSRRLVTLCWTRERRRRRLKLLAKPGRTVLLLEAPVRSFVVWRRASAAEGRRRGPFHDQRHRVPRTGCVPSRARCWSQRLGYRAGMRRCWLVSRRWWCLYSESSSPWGWPLDYRNGLR